MKIYEGKKIKNFMKFNKMAKKSNSIEKNYYIGELYEYKYDHSYWTLRFLPIDDQFKSRQAETEKLSKKFDKYLDDLCRWMENVRGIFFMIEVTFSQYFE